MYILRQNDQKSNPFEGNNLTNHLNCSKMALFQTIEKTTNLLSLIDRESAKFGQTRA